MSPGELGELKLVVAFLQRPDEENESDNVEHESNESVVSRQREKNLVDQQDVLEVVDDTFTVEIIHCGAQKIPVQGLCEPQASRSTRYVGDGNNLFEGYYLDSGNNYYDIDVAGEQDPEEECNHNKGPYCSSDEVLLLFLVLGLGRGFWDVGF